MLVLGQVRYVVPSTLGCRNVSNMQVDDYESVDLRENDSQVICSHAVLV
jgi:hypothetical protein